ncbi:MAG: hypothetical protein ACJ8HI_04085 [Massilia sp.]
MLTTVSFACIPAVAANTCSAKDADSAQTAVEGIESWPRLAQVHQRFAQCDVGYIAEGNSEAVARLLVDRWEDLSTLNAMGAKQPGFMAFVLRHIDSTLDTGDLEQIVRRASSRCLPNNQKLCARLQVAAKRALASPN